MIISFTVSTDDALLIKPGQTVDFKTPLSKKSFSKETKVNLASHLQIDPKNIFMHLTKVVGEDIEKGEVIAKRKTMFSEKNYTSEHKGTLKEINHEDGSILIDTKTTSEETLYCFFKGEVDDVKKNEVTLKVKKSKGYPVKEVSQDFGGEVFFIKDDKLAAISDEDVKRKVVLINSIASYNQVKLEVMGISGVVTVASAGEEGSTPRARLKSAEDWDEIQATDFPYCLVSQKNQTIYFYQ